jgi:WD40 repeat protein
MTSAALIIAQPSYRHWTPLPDAANAARALAADLEKHGYDVHSDLIDGGEKVQVETTLEDWFGNTAPYRLLILFWTGHGDKDDDSYLICYNSPRTGVTGLNAIDTRTLGTAIAKSEAEKILVILDTCYSGRGAAGIANAFSKVLATRVEAPGQERAIAVIASAHPLEEAQAGLFCNKLRSVLFELDPSVHRMWSTQDAFITADQLARAVRKMLPDDVSRPQHKADGMGLEFIPNPLYRPAPAESVEDRTWRLLEGPDGEHFDLAVRGIEVGEKTALHFAGRSAILRKLVKWLEDTPQGIRIVTGPPGAGKSAVMGRLATLSDPEYRQIVMKGGILPEGTVPDEGVINVAIHAKGKKVDDCARALALALRLSVGGEVPVDVEAVVAVIGKINKINRPLTILIDALDEAPAGQGRIIAERLIVPLGRLERVRVLVGSRRNVDDGALLPEGEERHGLLRAMFGADAKIDDLEDEQDTALDIAKYVQARLAASVRYRNKPITEVAVVAERVAARAEGSFLYARIVSRMLWDLGRLEDELPGSALEAFTDDLRTRFGTGEQRVDDLLAALAWGEGTGLTRRVWPLIANALTAQSRPYLDGDVAWVLERAGAHIIEAGEHGQAVYRLVHKALADNYRGRWAAREAHARIVGALTAGVEGAGWFDCDRYVWRYLADHAAQADGLAELMRDPGYLAVADPARLVTALPSLDGGSGRRLADVYNRVVDRLIGRPPVERLSLIHLMAQIEAPDLAPLLEPPVPTRWRCRWARVQPSTPHRVIGRHGESVNCVALGVIDGQAVLVSGSADNTIRLWDARSGALINQPLAGHTGEVTAVALGVIDGSAVVVSGSKDGTIRRWNAPGGSLICQLLTGHAGDVTAVALGAVDGRVAMASASGDGTIRLSDARTGSLIGQLLTGTTGVTAVALGAVDDRTVVVSGSTNGTIRLWDARSGLPIGWPLAVGHREDWVTAVAVGAVGDRAVVASGSHDGTIRLWDVHSRSPIGQPLGGHTDWVSAVALGVVDGSAVVASGGYDKTIRLWGARGESPVGQMLAGHVDGVTAVATGVVAGCAVVVSGSQDGNVWLWDARSGAPIRELGGHTDGVSAVALDVVDGRAIVASGSYDETLRLWDADTGALIGLMTGHTGDVNAVALGAVDGRAVVVSGSDDKTIRLWDAQSGTPIGRPLTVREMNWVNAVALGAVDGRAVVVSGSKDKTIRLWDVRRGKLIGNLKGHREWVTAVALGAVDGRAVVASGSRDGTIRLWDACGRRPIGQPLTGHTGLVTAVGLAAVDGHEVVVSGSDDHTIRLWDARTLLSEAVVDLGASVLSIACQSRGEIAVGMPTGLFLLKFQRDAEITKGEANGSTADDA